MRKVRWGWLAAVLCAALGACGHDSTSSSSATSGLLDSAGVSSIAMASTSVRVPVTLRLKSSSGQHALAVSAVSSNPGVATVQPSTCYLSSTDSSTCAVIVRGISSGSASISFSGVGLTTLVLPVSFGASVTPNYGQVQIGTFPSATAPSTSGVTVTAQLGSQLTVQTSLTGFNTPLDGVPILLSASGGASIVGNPQCNVDSDFDASHYCTYTVQLPASMPAGGTVSVSASVVGNAAADQTWNTPSVTVNLQSAAVPGTLVLQGLGAAAPSGMSSPMWAVLQDSSGVGATVVSLSPSGGISINPGSYPTSGAYQKLSCTLSSASPVCGFDLHGDSAGAASVAATAAGYSVAPLDLVVGAPDTSQRAVRFVNTNASPVWVGITGGSANSYSTSELLSTIDASTNGPNKMCGPSNPGGACPVGSTCGQGGANPSATTTYFCYWDTPRPDSGYQIATGGASGASASTTIAISDSSYDPVADITWSGNFFPREGCTLSSSGQLSCTIADCGGPGSGQACANGTGGAPGVATLPEVTLQRYSNDFYDISIIAGANVATSFGPDRTTSIAVPAAQQYSCGVAGASTQASPLQGADWQLATHLQEALVSGGSTGYSLSAQTATTPSYAYYQFISTVSPREQPGCTSSSACTTTGYVCGYDANAIDNGAASDYQTSCGAHLSWLSANALWALNATSSNAAPFHFLGSYASSSNGPIQFNQLFSCTAPTRSGYDTSNTDASRVCGCTNWGHSSFSIAGDATFLQEIAAPSTACAQNNTDPSSSAYNWTQFVLPTIAWLKKACPTCYTYPFDDMSSTFQCGNQASSSTGANSVPYVITFSGDAAGL